MLGSAGRRSTLLHALRVRSGRLTRIGDPSKQPVHSPPRRKHWGASRRFWGYLGDGSMGQLRVVLLFAALWVALAGSARAQDLARGKELFAMCSHCHGAQGQGDAMALAPSIA